MSVFMDIMKVISDKSIGDVKMTEQELKAQKQMVDSQFAQQMAMLKEIQAQQKLENEKLKFEQKKDGLNKELLKNMIDSGQVGQGPMAVGGDMVNQFAGVEVEPEAQGLPIINNMQA